MFHVKSGHLIHVPWKCKEGATVYEYCCFYMVLGHLICFRFCLYLDEQVIDIPWQRCKHQKILAFLHQSMFCFFFAKAEVDRILALIAGAGCDPAAAARQRLPR